MTKALPTTSPRLLIAGIGNIFLGDDAFGIEVAQRLAKRSWAEGITVADFGIRGIDLTYALLDDGYDAALLIDAVPRGQAPGTLYVIEPDESQASTSAHDEPAEADAEAACPSDPGEVMIDTHNMDPAKVLRLVTALGGNLRQVMLIGCEPSPPADSYEEMAAGLSVPVAAAVDRAIPLVEQWAGSMIQHLQTSPRTNQPNRLESLTAP